MYLPNSSTVSRMEHKINFKQSKTGLNSVFLPDWLPFQGWENSWFMPFSRAFLKEQIFIENIQYKAEKFFTTFHVHTCLLRFNLSFCVCAFSENWKYHPLLSWQAQEWEEIFVRDELAVCYPTANNLWQNRNTRTNVWGQNVDLQEFIIGY